MSTHPALDMSHTAMSEDDALRFLDGHRIRMGSRTMDPKAQIVGEFVKSIRVPGYYPPLPELRQQLRVMVTLMDEPAPELARVEDIRIPGPAGEIPARVYSSSAAKTPQPAVAYFHGGGWVQGDLETHNGLCARLAKHAGVLVVAVDYRLAPENKFPAAVEDCVAAYRWLREKGRDLGADTARVAVAGDSAGGNLSAVVSQLAASSGTPVPTCQVLIYPAVDASLETESHRELVDGHVIPRERIVWYMQQYLRNDADRTDLRVSPLRAASLKGQPPAMIVTAGFDPLRDEGRAYGDRLRQAGVEPAVTSEISAGIEFTTFSLIGRCERTGMFGVAISTSEMAVGSRCIHVAPGVGAIVTQASTNPRLGHLGLNLLRAGYSAPRVLDEIAASDPFVERRQLGCLDVTGLSAARTGSGNKPWAGHRVDRNVVVAANAVVGAEVADSMFDAFKRGADLALWERLLRSLEAGKAAGGQPDGETSSGLYVVDRDTYPMVDLRVDLHASPVTELRRLADAYFPLVSYYNLRPRDPNVPPAAEWLQRHAGG